MSTQEDVQAAISAAKKAFKGWAQTPWEERQQAIFKFADALEKHVDDFAKLLTTEQGKPVCPLVIRLAALTNNRS